MTNKGLFVAIEGGDGSGKGTQALELEKRAQSEGYDVFRVSFPQYDKISSKIASNYLNGKYGAANEVHPELASLPYAIDRYAAKESILGHLAKPNSLVIADRYVASNLAHQGTKIVDNTERYRFYKDLLEIEYDLLKLPKPDINIVLLVPSSLAQQNVDKKAARSYTSQKRDIHEIDASHLDKAKENYEELSRLYPEEFTAIECLDKNNMRTIKDIHEDIWSYIKTKEQKHETVS